MATTESAPKTPLVIRVDGDLEGRALSDLIDAVADAVVVNSADLVVDLSRVRRINDLVLGVLERTWVYMNYRGRSLSVRAPAPSVRAVIDARGLAGLVESPAAADGTRCARADG